ncbi:hypothetical protein COT75_03570 [Candidatus Beckwithbacteria bacterium CG10_big_fil_rev_8_21_14_0_10_34_10]|uniref:Uncharacterized protein n=1 Tax=Candidatus Beckwithbacteria bacterium CG10_big_fil_rev_8_21_14_0_10_34_10 TaxID=1974495 RepID=A0A2H0WAZ5_9BACT|nr:MAG: hypothetical protein COT75_03570 [Candidatus Beckwithbacteria bacterium CG10_big_fil_rev_8_21_14_0_10_34_10]
MAENNPKPILPVNDDLHLSGGIESGNPLPSIRSWQQETSQILGQALLDPGFNLHLLVETGYLDMQGLSKQLIKEAEKRVKQPEEETTKPDEESLQNRIIQIYRNYFGIEEEK